ncbi:probable polyamine transporter At3g19553 isoform X1 [Physcomitrium patens]|uniref:Uncharacterized protein n=1 Tax=Physcomitrium patens TaxID=3218 RepID=A0A7I3ZCN0_PHYPA|nr:probable polyamine transporter At3g19553 isoform X1 [Physcomitrium patens]|eukprot:XP_024371692.1 probable polyamine transporter At3g19553 isoform X1 [Physcomitrella patens]
MKEVMPVIAPHPLNREEFGINAGEEGQDTPTASEQSSPRRGSVAKLSMLPLVALIFYEVSGGPFGLEDSVRAGGPLLALLGFIIVPFVWSIPEALVTAELATAFPKNGGFVVWISAAFGPFWGFQEGWLKWMSGVTDNALYPVLFLDYLKRGLPVFAKGPARVAALLLTTVGLTYLNYRGLTIVGITAVALAIFTLLPFFVFSLLAIPKIQMQRWFVMDLRSMNWRVYLNILFWNLNYWDNVSTLAGEVDKPSQTLPKALLWAVVLVTFTYIVPLLAGTGAVELDRAKWEDGYLADVALVIGGAPLKCWITIAAALSNMGLFEAEMSSNSFQLLGMGENGLLPQVFEQRSKYGTPSLGILCSATGVIILSWMSFQEIIEFLNFLYCFGMLLEFAAFIWLRVQQPNLLRPFCIPLNTAGVSLLLLPPSIFLLSILVLASLKTIILGVFISMLGFVVYPGLEVAKQKRWFKFSASPKIYPKDVEVVGSSSHDAHDEGSGLLT